MRRLWLLLALTALVPLAIVTSPGMAQDLPALDGSQWRLELVDGKPLPPAAQVTASFADGRVTGKAGVNRYFAAYNVDGRVLTFGEIGSTKMAGPEDLMAVESCYLDALKAVRTYQLVDEKLELWDAADVRRLVLVRAGPDTALTGVEWRLEALDGQPVAADVAVTATFADGRVSGKAAINRYITSYTVDGETLQFGEAAAVTLMAGPEHLMAVEDAYLKALKATHTHRLADGKLELFDGTGTKRLVFGRGMASLEIIEPGAPLYLEDGMLWVPMRSLSVWMGATVQWQAATLTATASIGERQFVADGRANVARGAGREWRPKWQMLRPSGLMYVPLDALAPSLGAEVITRPDDHVLIIAIGGRRGTLTAP